MQFDYPVCFNSNFIIKVKLKYNVAKNLALTKFYAKNIQNLQSTIKLLSVYIQWSQLS